MTPNEFYECTYKQLYTFVKANIDKDAEDYKKQIILFDSLGNKIIDVIGKQRPKGISLVRNTFKSLFKEELEPTYHQQTLEEQIRILRSMK